MLMMTVEVTLTLGREMQTEYRTRWAPGFSVACNWFIALFLYNIECASLRDSYNLCVMCDGFFPPIFYRFSLTSNPNRQKLRK